MSRLDDLRSMRAFIDREIAAELFAPMSEMATENPVIQCAARFYEVPACELVVAGRSTRQIARARHAAAWLLRNNGWSFGDIARLLGYADHTGARDACQKIDSDPPTRTLLRGLAVA